MKAITFRGERTVRHEEVPDPGIEAAGDALVRVEVSAVCGSDLHPYRGLEIGLDAGTTMGHEAAGTVLEVGDAVRDLQVGDRVAIPFTTSCGDCFFCREGLTSRCLRGELFGWKERGRGLAGLQAECARVPLAATTLIRLPEGVSFEEGLLLGDIAATGAFCADLAAAGPRRALVVIGCGPVGLMAILAAQAAGAERIWAVDRIPARLTLASNFGAVPIDPTQEDPPAMVREATEGRGADGVMELAGGLEAARLAWECVRAGGTIASVAVHAEDRMAFTPAEAYSRNITFRTGRCPARAYVDRLLPRLGGGMSRITDVISHRLPLADGERAYRMFDERQAGCVKILLVP